MVELPEMCYCGDDEDFSDLLAELPYRVPLLAGGSLRPGDASYQDAVLHYICWATAWKFWLEPLESPTADG